MTSAENARSILGEWANQQDHWVCAIATNVIAIKTASTTVKSQEYFQQFNTGLYLLCRFKKQDEPEKVYSFAFETFLTAKSLRGKHFNYPSDFDPQSHFDGNFGFIRTQNDKHNIVIEYRVDCWVRQYLRDQRWTGNESYECSDGVTETFSMTVTDLRDVVSWILSLCDQVNSISGGVARAGCTEG